MGKLKKMDTMYQFEQPNAVLEQAQDACAHDVAVQLKGLHALKRLFNFRCNWEALVAKRAQRLDQVLHLGA